MQTQYGYGRTVVISPSQQLAMSRFVTRTYGWMFLGLLLTGAVSFMIASSEVAVQTIIMNRWVFIGAIVLELAVVMGLTFAYQRLSPAMATLGFLFYSALNGVTFATVFLAYTMNSVAHVFFITAGMFGGLALFGSVTKKDLTGLGTFVGMGLWGLILIGLANMFIQSQSLSLGLAVGGVLIFSGLTAYDAQKIRSMAYHYATDGGVTGEADKGAVFGALTLYLNFINLFLSLLRLFGERK
ncbi:MAG: Bax inhibitor-1/YccA family protein [Bdellovibrionota bacterium]